MNSISDLILPIGIAVAVYCWWFFSYRTKKYYKNLPTPPTVPFFGNALDFKSTAEILPTMLKYTKEYGGLVKVQMGPIKQGLVVSDYKALEFILNSPKIPKKSTDYEYLDEWLGTGLLTGSGPKWKKHRKILTPAFHFQVLTNFVDTFESCGNILIEKLSKEVGKDSVDVYPFITLCSLDIICESTMGTSINAQDDINSEYVFSVKEMCRIIIERSTKLLQMHDYSFFFTKNYSAQKKAIRILQEKSNSVIEKRRKELENESKNNDDDNETKKKKVFLDTLLEATVDGQPLTQDDIREEVNTFMFAGHDTTAAAISFTLFCLAKHPEVQQTAFNEQQSLFGDNRDPTITYADLQSMKYLEQVIKETLRLYPSVPIIGRQATEDVEYGNTCIPKRDVILLFLFGIHRDPTYFDKPEIFDPNRFENPERKLPYSHIPFSAGPRNCIGQKFAMLEMKSVISKIIRKFELGPARPEHNLRLVAETVLKSSNGIKISLKMRS